MLKDFGEDSEAFQYSGRENLVHSSLSFKGKKAALYPWQLINPCSGVAFVLNNKDLLVVQDIQGEQVADLFCYAVNDKDEFLSSGKTIDYNGKIAFSTGDYLYSNKSNHMLKIIMDEVKMNDFLFAPCSYETFKILYGTQRDQAGCYEHLIRAFRPYKFPHEYLSTTFNIFMNVAITPKGRTKIKPPLSKAGDNIVFQSQMDLIVGLTACSAPQSNNNSLKPIRFKILKKRIY